MNTIKFQFIFRAKQVFFGHMTKIFYVKEKFDSENFTLYLRDIIEKRSIKKEKSLIKYIFFSGFVATNEEKKKKKKN